MNYISQLTEAGRYSAAAIACVLAIGVVLFCLNRHRRDRPLTRGVYSSYGRRERRLNPVEKVLARLRII